MQTYSQDRRQAARRSALAAEQAARATKFRRLGMITLAVIAFVIGAVVIESASRTVDGYGASVSAYQAKLDRLAQ